AVRVEHRWLRGLRQDCPPHQCSRVAAAARRLDRRDAEDPDRAIGLVAHRRADAFAVDPPEPVSHAWIWIRWMNAACRDVFAAEAADADGLEFDEIAWIDALDCKLVGSECFRKRNGSTHIPHLNVGSSKSERRAL